MTRLMRLAKKKDGSLTKDEVGVRFQPLIARVDENQDGTATRAEIEAFIRNEGASAAGRSDGRGDGRGPGRPGGNPKEIVNRIFEENDKDKDGKLSGPEITDRLKRNLERIDTNKDGVIEKPELEADFSRPAPM